MNVITYTTPAGRKLNLSEAQIAVLKARGEWPRVGTGAEYCQVSHGLHVGTPTYTDRELLDYVIHGQEPPHIRIGDRVEAGEPGTEDHDTGNVLEIDGAKARIGWDTGVQTWTPISDLAVIE